MAGWGEDALCLAKRAIVEVVMGMAIAVGRRAGSARTLPNCRTGAKASLLQCLLPSRRHGLRRRGTSPTLRRKTRSPLDLPWNRKG